MKRSVETAPVARRPGEPPCGPGSTERAVCAQAGRLIRGGRIADLRALLESLAAAHGENFGGAALWTARLVVLREDGPRDPACPASPEWQERARRLAGEVEAGLEFSGLYGERLAALGLACVGLGWADLALRVSRCLIAEFDMGDERFQSCLGENGPFDLLSPLLALLLDQGRNSEVDDLIVSVASLGRDQRRLAQRWRTLLPGAASPGVAQARTDRVLTFLRWRALDDPTYFLDRGLWDES